MTVISFRKPPTDKERKDHRALSVQLAANLLKLRKILDAQAYVAKEQHFATLHDELVRISDNLEMQRCELLNWLQLQPAASLIITNDDD